MERKKLKNNMKMTLATMQAEDEKAAVIEQNVENSIKQQQEAEKILKADVTN